MFEQEMGITVQLSGKNIDLHVGFLNWFYLHFDIYKYSFYGIPSSAS